MKTVFIGGSRITEGTKGLPESVLDQIKDITTKQYNIVVGDSNGVDFLVQKYLSELGYDAVSIYYSGNQPRNRVNMKWKALRYTEPGKSGKDLQMVKDKKMAEDADIAYMIWSDTYINPRFGNKCVSNGTLSNIYRMLSSGKTVVVYYIPNDKTYILHTQEDFLNLLYPIIDLSAQKKYDELSNSHIQLGMF